ncbi:MAG: sigma 54-interacting transcriptional regulator [Desulfobacterales bacterium]
MGCFLSDTHQIILDSITDGVFTVDLNLTITSFNRAAEQITGIPRSEAIGKPCFEVFRANICESGCMLRRTMETANPIFNIPVHIYRADKKQIPISVTTAILRNTDGQVEGVVETFRDLSTVHSLRKALQKQHQFEDIVSKNPAMLSIFSVLPQIAQSQSTVLIQGPSGTGKELIARALHHHSRSSSGPFVAVNCGALPDTLIESELFGYKAGAFTDAKKDKPGRFTLAHGGTIFLDEIGDFSPSVQISLLRVLEEKAYEPLGATAKQFTDARVIAATHRDLVQMVRENRFREDLFFRINVIRLTLPSLKERKEDIPLLVDHFIEHFNHQRGKQILGATQEAMGALMLYDWPGNIRELENAIEHAVVLCRDELIHAMDLPSHLNPERGKVQVQAGLELKEIEKRAILATLEKNDWKKVITARDLGIDKNTLRRKIRRHGITAPNHRP